MKLNISYPATGCQKVFEVDDEQKIKHFYDKRMAQVSKIILFGGIIVHLYLLIFQEVPADHLGDEWKGYVFRVTLTCALDWLHQFVNFIKSNKYQKLSSFCSLSMGME